MLVGVSTATVSRVTNSAGKVPGKTRAKVLISISRLQYYPNAHASELGRANGCASKRRIGHLPALAFEDVKEIADRRGGASVARARRLTGEVADLQSEYKPSEIEYYRARVLTVWHRAKHALMHSNKERTSCQLHAESS
jgi:hypothetical protein